MKNKLIIGRYLPNHSTVHHLDPRAKLIFVFVFIVYIFFCHSFGTYAWIFLLIIVFMKLAKIPFGFLILTIESDGVLEGIYISLRLIFIVMIATIMTLSTSPIDLTDAFERLLSPLKLVKVPVHQLSMMMSIALRFIPTLMDELEKIILAQKSRGSEISSGSIVTRIKSFIPLMIPLFISAFQRAEELAIAMEVRGYDMNVKRTSYRLLHWRLRDTFALLTLIPIAIILYIIKFSGV